MADNSLKPGPAWNRACQAVFHNAETNGLFMNIYERLTKDHDLQRSLCESLGETQGDSKDRQRLWDILRVELKAHASAEEQTLYAALIKHPDGTDKARHSVHEHEQMNDLIDDLDETAMDSGGWLNKFKKLAHKVTHHLDEEEKEVFKLAEKLIPDNQAEDLAIKFNIRKPNEECNEDVA
jgi:hemerythrin superfamily protein